MTKLPSVMVVVAALALTAVAAGLSTVLRLAPASLLEGIEIMGWVAAAILLVFAILQRRTASVLITGALVVTIGWLFARIYLWFFEPICRGAGAVRLRSGKSGSEPR